MNYNTAQFLVVVTMPMKNYPIGYLVEQKKFLGLQAAVAYAIQEHLAHKGLSIFVKVLPDKQIILFFGNKQPSEMGIEATAIQSMIFDRKSWTLLRAKKWLHDRRYSYYPDVKLNTFHFRQFNPDEFIA